MSRKQEIYLEFLLFGLPSLRGVRHLFRPGHPLLGAGLLGQGYGVLGRDDSRAEPVGVGLGELGAEKDDLRGIVNPHEQSHQRAGRPVGRGDAAAADVEPQQKFPEREQSAVSAAPIQTSPQPISASGTSLKIMANSSRGDHQ